MAFETDLIRRYSGAFSKEDCTRIIEGIHFFEKNHLLYYDKNKLAREDHKTVNITHEYDFSSSSRLAEDIFPKLKPCVDEYLQAFGVLGLRKFLLHDIKLKEIPAGGGFHAWHYENGALEVSRRQFVVQVYLNDEFEGGETEFSSMRIAYQQLPEEMKLRIEGLRCIHDYVFSRSQVAPVDANHAASLPPVEQKLVRTNPANKLKNYYVGSHARSIVGWGGIESRKLLDDLLERATQPELVYRHPWQVGDTVVWDNRCLLHRGAGYDANRWRRLMRQTRVAGKGNTLQEA